MTVKRVLGCKPVYGLAAAAVLAGLAVPPSASAVLAVTPAKVSVDFGSRQGELLRTERFNNFGNVTAWPEQRERDVAFFNEQGLHGSVHRVWLSSPNARAEDVFNQCDLVTNTCDLSAVDAYLAQASTLSDSVLVVLNPIDFVEGKRPLEDLAPMVELILRNVKAKYPKVKYVEVFNEPDFNYHGTYVRNGGTPVIQPEELYRFYPPFYQAVNTVNAELAPAVPLVVGGPAFSGFTDRWMSAFLDGYAADPDAAKRLEFISWHGYGHFTDDFLVFNQYKNDPSQVRTQRARLEAMLQTRGVSTDIPAFITETGIYPGPAFDVPVGKTDYVRQAAGVASVHYWYASQPRTYPFHWAVRHRIEERKDQLVTRSPGGPLLDTFTPYGNAMLMQSKMKLNKVSAVSDSLTLGKGVYAIASNDGSGATVMVWNYQGINPASFRATIDMSNLPPSLAGKPLRQTTFRIDQTTSNYWADPARANLQQVDEKVVTPGASYSQAIDLEPNALYLIVLEKTA